MNIPVKFTLVELNGFRYENKNVKKNTYCTCIKYMQIDDNGPNDTSSHPIIL